MPGCDLSIIAELDKIRPRLAALTAAESPESVFRDPGANASWH
jgi:hypothetical protein